MVTLSANQHELLADDAAGGLLFGTQSTGYVTLSHPSKEPGDGGGSEFARMREDGVQYGEEYDGAASVAFEVGVLTDRDPTDPSGANGDALDLFESTWRSPRWRNRFGAYGVLRSNMKGRTRRCYGRPRRFAATEDGLAKKGYSTFLCDFSVQDGKWYDDVATTATTPAAGAPGGQRQTSITVGGTQDAWPVVTMRPGSGSLISPVVTLGPLVLSLPGAGFTGANASLTIDGRPWRRQFVRNNDPSLPTGGIVPSGGSTLLRDFHLPAGTHQLTLTADTLPANATVSVEWRNAWSRW